MLSIKSDNLDQSRLHSQRFMKLARAAYARVLPKKNIVGLHQITWRRKRTDWTDWILVTLTLFSYMSNNMDPDQTVPKKKQSDRDSYCLLP